MRYYEQDAGGCVIAIEKGYGNLNCCMEISEQRYNDIANILLHIPQKQGCAYRLRTDLTWEEVVAPPTPEPELTPEELMQELEEIL